jgi:hypothetical protein
VWTPDVRLVSVEVSDFAPCPTFPTCWNSRTSDGHKVGLSGQLCKFSCQTYTNDVVVNIPAHFSRWRAGEYCWWSFI